MTRDADRVARDHIAAVRSGDPVLMAADYAPEAVLERPGEVYRGRAEIEAYFQTVPSRLGEASVVFDDLSVDGDIATFWWHLEGAEVAASGSDVCTVEAGAIVHQIVRLGADDF